MRPTSARRGDVVRRSRRDRRARTATAAAASEDDWDRRAGWARCDRHSASARTPALTAVRDRACCPSDRPRAALRPSDHSAPARATARPSGHLAPTRAAAAHPAPLRVEAADWASDVAAAGWAAATASAGVAAEARRTDDGRVARAVAETVAGCALGDRAEASADGHAWRPEASAAASRAGRARDGSQSAAVSARESSRLGAGVAKARRGARAVLAATGRPLLSSA